MTFGRTVVPDVAVPSGEAAISMRAALLVWPATPNKVTNTDTPSVRCFWNNKYFTNLSSAKNYESDSPVRAN